MKIEEKKQYYKNYNESKIFYCEICDIEVKIYNKWNHLNKSPTHKKNMEKSNK